MNTKRILALLICLSIVLCTVSVATNAKSETTTELEIGAEVVSLREENVKHFKLGNGTYQAIAYSHPVHELDKNGNWQNIDFDMTLTRKSGTSVYVNEAGNSTFSANYIANQPIMTLGEEGTSITTTLLTDSVSASTWTISNTSVEAEVTSAQVDIQTLEDTQNTNFSSTVLYEEVMPGIDLEYVVDPWYIKENIVVKEPSSSYVYEFLLDLDGMYPVMQDEGSIHIYSKETDQVVYEIPAPYMYDANGEISFDVFYTLHNSGEKYYLSVLADASWVNATERCFPVTIDPSYVYSELVNMDTYINGSYANETRGSCNFFYVGENEVAYIKEPIPVLPVGATLEQAALRVYYFYKNTVSSGSVQVTAHQVTGFDWDENNLTWNDVVAIDPTNYGLSTSVLMAENDSSHGIRTTYGDIGAYADSPELTAFDITDAVQSWINGTPNYGIGLRYVTTSSNKSVMFRSTEGPSNYRPRIQYQYHVPYSIENIKEVDLLLYYDNAYKSRFSNSQERITREAEELQLFFLEEFDIKVNLTSPTSFVSSADTCPSDYTEFCNCVDPSTCKDSILYEDGTHNIYNYHHTNIFNILHHLPETTNSTSVKMFYIGHDTCQAQGEGHVRSYTHGVAIQKYGRILVNNLQSETLENITAIHEMGHMFKVKDHYDKYIDKAMEAQGYSDDCIYGIIGKDVTQISDIQICDYCRNIIKQNRGLYSG